MDELIRKQDALDAFNGNVTISAPRNAGRVYTYLKMVTDRIKALPPVQPEIIRCKECRYYEWMSNRVPDEQTWFCHNWNAETGKDDYCSYAERREE